MTTTTSPTTTATSTTGAGRGRAAEVALWVLQGLTAALYVFGAVPKLTADPMAVDGFAQLGMGLTGMYVIGALEVAGAVALLVPRLCGLAALAFVGLMVGAVIATAATGGPVVVPAAVLVLVAFLAWARRDRTVALWHSLRR